MDARVGDGAEPERLSRFSGFPAGRRFD